MVVAGHDHTYERFDINGFPYFVNGLGGKGGPPLSPPFEPGSQVAWKNGYGAQLVEATDQYIKLDFIATNNVVIDSFSLGTVSNPEPERGLFVTEIMYDPAGSNEHEYVELYNTTTASIDLSNYTFYGRKLADGSSIDAGGTAVIVRTDSAARPLQNYFNAWGSGINFVELDKQGAEFPAWPGLANGGSTVQIVDDQAQSVASITYDNAPPWPINNDSSSIYLTDLAASNFSDGAVWARSVAGQNFAYTGGAPRSGDVGSPGVVFSADFDNDGDVDGGDFLAWQRGLGIATGATNAQGDANNDLTVDEADFAVWQQQFGRVASTPAGAVPEPQGVVLFLAAVGLAFSPRSKIARLLCVLER